MSHTTTFAAVWMIALLILLTGCIAISIFNYEPIIRVIAGVAAFPVSIGFVTSIPTFKQRIIG